MRASKFLGYMITNRGIEVKINQIEAVEHLRPPSNPKGSPSTDRYVSCAEPVYF